MNILACTSSEYVQYIFATLAKGKEQAKKGYAQWTRTGSFPFKPALFQQIAAKSDFTLPQLVASFQNGGVEKMILQLSDSLQIESVVIPMQFGISLCVSSQVGCRMGCTFCQTGRMGLVRHLSVAEIVAQLFIAKHLLGYRVRNIVFMGMGEPFDNFDTVHQAIKIFTDPLGFNIAPKHITISTSGRLDGIKRMRLEIDPCIRLALSINAPNDTIRKKIMPLTRKYNMPALKEELLLYCQHPQRTLLAEYVLLKGITDSLEAADELASYLKGLPVRINLIPYNPQISDPYAPPDQTTLQAFKKRLQEHGYHTLLRLTKGADLRAACGQLTTRV